MSLIQYSIVFLAGVYVGQEYKNVPSVKNQAIKLYGQFKETDFYKKLSKEK